MWNLYARSVYDVCMFLYIYIHIHDMYACRKQNVLAQVTMFRTKRSGLEQSHGKIGNRSENAVATDPKRQDPT